MGAANALKESARLPTAKRALRMPTGMSPQAVRASSSTTTVQMVVAARVVTMTAATVRQWLL
jgi:DNA-binding transcriptional regulator YiaG